MTQLKKAISSSVGRKFVMAISGLGLVLYLIVHLVGNLTLYAPNGDAFNLYANNMQSLGKLVLVIEIGLLVCFLIHIYSGIRVTLSNRAARPSKYKMLRSKQVKEPTPTEVTPSNVSSRNMAITGVVLLVFLLIHVKQFRFPDNMGVTSISGLEVKDLYSVTTGVFQNPAYVAFYMISMLVVGLHLRHGFWSAFHSLGLMHPKFARPIYAIGVLTAVLLTVGFFFIPAWIFFRL